MKTLGGVGAVVMGAMLLLTVKVGPAKPQPVPTGSEKMHPLAANAAVPEAPPRRTPAAAPVPGPAQVRRVTTATTEHTILVVVPGEGATQQRKSRRVEIPQALECNFELELPVFSKL